MSKRIKEGVSIRGLHPQMFHAWDIASDVFEELARVDAICTSAVDGTHSKGSLHYVGYGLDLRIRHIPEDPNLGPTLKDRALFIRNEIAERLGPEYDVVLEGTHIHIEFQPKEQVD